MTLRGSRSRRCVRARRPRIANPRADPDIFFSPDESLAFSSFFRYFRKASSRLTRAPSREPSPEPKQVVVLMMSVCFIAFVTMLHAVSKIYQYTSS